MLVPALVVIGVINAITFAAFAIDKWKAKAQRRRVPEATLCGLALATGLLGAWGGMYAFRHKTRKRSFQLKMVAVTVLNPLWLAVYLYLT
ncbi:MAG: DUF1294 domain-containing protein [Planctomycetota bacterium]